MKSALRTRSASLAAMVLLGAASGAAHAGSGNNNLLKGDYAFSGEATCLVSPGGFNANLTPVGPPAAFPFVVSFSIQGIRRFNGDGTGTVRARSVGMRHPSAIPVSPTPIFNRGSTNATELEATFVYQVADDLTFTLSNVTVNGTVAAPAPVAGAPGPDTVVITNLPVFVGAISKDHKTLTLAHYEPTPETHTFRRWNGSAFVESTDERICHRSRILLEWKGN